MKRRRHHPDDCSGYDVQYCEVRAWPLALTVCGFMLTAAVVVWAVMEVCR